MKFSIQDMANQYRQIRKDVFLNATKPNSLSEDEYVSNQKKLKSGIIDLCDKADLSRLDNTNIESDVWEHMWKKIRYAGIKAVLAGREIQDIEFYFNQYQHFLSKDWDVKSKGHELIGAGSKVINFKQRTGVFSNKLTVGNVPKLKRTVNLARGYSEHLANGRSVKSFLIGDNDISDVWAIHQHLQKNSGYGAQITTLHLMMDLGFSVVKPDIILTRLFVEKGWLQSRYSDLPNDLTNDDIVGRGKYRSKYTYTKPLMYKRVIDLANEIVSACTQTDLEADIGWVTNNPLREFDIFMVKYAQVPEEKYGLVRTLYSS
jgi:hypothetical protein